MYSGTVSRQFTCDGPTGRLYCMAVWMDCSNADAPETTAPAVHALAIGLSDRHSRDTGAERARVQLGTLLPF